MLINIFGSGALANNVIIDSGPLFALFNSRDHYNQWASRQAATIKAPLVTCEAVISETTFLMMRNNMSLDALFEFINRGDLVIKPVFNTKPNQRRIRNIVKNYANLPASFADACLVHMARYTRGARIFTLDADFHIYRDTDDNPLSLISQN